MTNGRPQPLRRELLNMARLDRTVRAELAASGTLFNTGYEPRMARIHRRNAQRLWRIVESVGWPGTDLVGPDGAEAAWLILQHAISEPDLLRLALPLLTTAAREGKADPAHAAMLEDRIRFFEGRPQRYGTQFDWDADGNLSTGEVDDPQRLAERRDAVGLPPLEEQTEAVRSQAIAEGQRASGGLPSVRRCPQSMGVQGRVARKPGPVTTHRIARMVDQLGAAVPIRADDCPAVPKKPGLYMFTEDGRVMWVGTATDHFAPAPDSAPVTASSG